jgi:hypothetical protein
MVAGGAQADKAQVDLARVQGAELFTGRPVEQIHGRFPVGSAEFRQRARQEIEIEFGQIAEIELAVSPG